MSNLLVEVSKQKDPNFEFVEDYSSAAMGLPSDAALPSYSLYFSPNQPLQPRLMHAHHMQSWNHDHYKNGSSSAVMLASNPSSGYMVLVDSRRIQGMEATIQHLRELLSKEIVTNMEARITINKLNKDLRSSKNPESPTPDCVSGPYKELITAQHDLIVAQKNICNLKDANSLLENKVAQLQQELEKLRIHEEPHDDACENISKSEDKDEEIILSEDKDESIILSEDKDEEKKLSEDDDKEQSNILQQLNITKEINYVLKQQFKELAKKHLLIINYSGEQTYNEMEQKHKEFIQNLELQKGDSLANDSKCSMIKHTHDCVQEQLKMLDTCRGELKLTVALLMDRIDEGLALVSDLNFCLPKPQLEIPIDNFDPMLQLISRIGSAAESNSENENRQL